MFQRVMASFGQGGAKVDAQLLDSSVQPGGSLRGEVMLAGGQVDQDIATLGVTLLARVEAADARGRITLVDIPFQLVNLASKTTVAAGQQLTVPFEVQLPWETPITSVFGKHLTGMAVGLQTNLDLARTIVDPQDIDAVAIEPLQAQHRILDAISHLGFVFTNAALEYNRITGLAQQLPFYQEIRFGPSPEFAEIFDELAVTFLTRPSKVQVVLDVNKRVRIDKGNGLLSAGRPLIGFFEVDPDAFEDTDWEEQIKGWLDEAAKPRGIFD